MTTRDSLGAESRKAIEVAVIGGGCASIAAAFELTRPEHDGRYHVTVYQLGWRLGGKGASGRGAAARIEEHGLHVWMGFYENAFRLVRECYGELGRDWRKAFVPQERIGFADRDADGEWRFRTAAFTAPGVPGDPLSERDNPFTVEGYLTRTVELLRTLLIGVQTEPASPPVPPAAATSRDTVVAQIAELFRFGLLSTTAGLINAVGVLKVVFVSLPSYPQNVVLDLLERIAATVKERLEGALTEDPEALYKWEIIDLVLAIIAGIVRHGLLYHPKGFDSINDYECLDWLQMNGASERSVKSGFVRALYDLAFAYGTDGPDPGIAAGQAIRGALRMLFTYRGAMFWTMQGGMGDVVFAPAYEALRRRGVRFEFFHRLENVGIAEPEKDGEAAYVEALEFAVQAKVKRGQAYEPLVDVGGLACWPSEPEFRQLVGGARLAREERDFESDWDERKVSTKVLRVGRDFDFVVLAIGIGGIPRVCSEILARDERWRTMIEHVKTVETQAFQVWLHEDMESLGWSGPAAVVSAYVNPFNTWADMRHLIGKEGWPAKPGAIAYFCNRLPEDTDLDRSDPRYPEIRREQVRQNAVRFLNEDIQRMWPAAGSESGGFRWSLLLDPVQEHRTAAADEDRFGSQYWTASVNGSDRYVLAPPGSLQYRISPLDSGYDNLTIAGDWTDCGFNEGCVEAAVMSGRLAAHALSLQPRLEDIIGYDHP